MSETRVASAWALKTILLAPVPAVTVDDLFDAAEAVVADLEELATVYTPHQLGRAVLGAVMPAEGWAPQPWEADLRYHMAGLNDLLTRLREARGE